MGHSNPSITAKVYAHEFDRAGRASVGGRGDRRRLERSSNGRWRGLANQRRGGGG
jgi:hypothetical protein